MLKRLTQFHQARSWRWGVKEQEEEEEEEEEEIEVLLPEKTDRNGKRKSASELETRKVSFGIGGVGNMSEIFCSPVLAAYPADDDLRACNCTRR